MDQQSKKIQLILKEFLKYDFSQEKNLLLMKKKITSILKGKEKYEKKYLDILNEIKEYNPVVLKKFINQYSNSTSNLDKFYKSFISNKQNLEALIESKSMTEIIQEKEESEQQKKMFSSLIDFSFQNASSFQNPEENEMLRSSLISLINSFENSLLQMDENNEKTLEELQKEFDESFEKVEFAGSVFNIQKASKYEKELSSLKQKTSNHKKILNDLKTKSPIELVDFSRKFLSTNTSLEEFIKKYEANKFDTKATEELIQYIQIINSVPIEEKEAFISSIDADASVPSAMKNLILKYYNTNFSLLSDIPSVAVIGGEIPVEESKEKDKVLFPSSSSSLLLNLYNEKQKEKGLPNLEDVITEEMLKFVKDYLIETGINETEANKIIDDKSTRLHYEKTSELTGEAEFKVEKVTVQEFLNNIEEYIKDISKPLLQKKVIEVRPPSMSPVKKVEPYDIDPIILDSSDVVFLTPNFMEPVVMINKKDKIKSQIDALLTINDKLKLLKWMYNDEEYKAEKEYVRRLFYIFVHIKKLNQSGFLTFEEQKNKILSEINSDITEERKSFLFDVLTELDLFNYLKNLLENKQSEMNERYEVIKKEDKKELNLESQKLKLIDEFQKDMQQKRKNYLSNINVKVTELLDNYFEEEYAPSLFNIFDSSVKSPGEKEALLPSITFPYAKVEGEPPTAEVAADVESVEPLQKKRRLDRGSKRNKKKCENRKCNNSKLNIKTLMLSDDDKMVDMEYCSIKCLDKHEY